MTPHKLPSGQQAPLTTPADPLSALGLTIRVTDYVSMIAELKLPESLDTNMFTDESRIERFAQLPSLVDKFDLLTAELDHSARPVIGFGCNRRVLERALLDVSSVPAVCVTFYGLILHTPDRYIDDLFTAFIKMRAMFPTDAMLQLEQAPPSAWKQWDNYFVTDFNYLAEEMNNDWLYWQPVDDAAFNYCADIIRQTVDHFKALNINFNFGRVRLASSTKSDE